jgi:acetolactate synthase-1/2/3 large subunit
MSGERNGAQAICAALAQAGIDTVFGVPGTQTVALYEALRTSTLQTVTASHELAASFMAQGYARASGRLAAVSTIPGPGFSFALASLPEATLDSVPLLLLTGQPARCPLGRRRAQAIDQRTIAAPLVKAVLDVDDPGHVAHTLHAACALARDGEPGPVLVQVAVEVYRAPAPAPSAPPPAVAAATPPPTLPAALDFIVGAERVLFYVGQGAADTGDQLLEVVDALAALVCTTPSARGTVPEDHARLLPLDATGDLSAFNTVARSCDAIVVLGAALSENGSVGFGLQFDPRRLVRVDLSAAVLAAPPAAHHSLQMPAATFVDALRAAAARASRPPQRGIAPDAARAMRLSLRERRSDSPSDARIGGARAAGFFAALRRALPADSCLVLDSGMHQLLARRHFVVLRPRGLIFPTDFQSMAFGLPAAIGAKLARPALPVVALIGDGGFTMSGLELRTAVKLGLSLPVVVFDDQALGLIRLDQLLASGQAHATDLAPFDYEAMAAAVGCAHARADARDIEQQLAAALGRRGPTLIVVGVGDAPALTRVRVRHRVTQTAKRLLGRRALEVLRRLR